MLAAAIPSHHPERAAKGVVEEATSLREAFQLLLAIDSQAPEAEIRAKGVAFAERFAELIKTPRNEFIQGFFSFCISARQRELGRNVPATDLEHVPPTGFPTSIWYGITILGQVARYSSPYGGVENDGWGTLAFQRDVCRYVESLAKEAYDQSPLSRDTLIKLNEFAANVLVCFRKRIRERTSLATTPADEVAKVLKLCDPIAEPTLRLLASQLAASENISLSKSLTAILRRMPDQIPGIDRDAITRLTTWAKDDRLSSLDDLDPETHRSTLSALSKATRALMDTELAAALELKWMSAVEAPLRSFKFATNDATSSPLVRLLGATRFQRETLAHLERAAAEIAREGLQGLSIEIDRSPFVWPRIAELIAITNPSAVKVRVGEAPSTPPPVSAVPINPIFLSHFGKQHLPISLVISPADTLRSEVGLLTARELSWVSPTEARCDILGRTVSFLISDQLASSREARKLLSLSKPIPHTFTIRDPKSEPLPEDMPRAFGVFFSDIKREVPGYRRLEFGGALALFVSLKKPEPKRASSRSQPPTPLTSSPTAPRRTDPRPQPPPREQRPTITSDLATVAKIALLEIPAIQEAARKSSALTPRIPFSEQEVIVTLNILKNGERPGTKSLKGLRGYVTDDTNFKDCGLKAVSIRTSLETLVDQLLTR